MTKEEKVIEKDIDPKTQDNNDELLEKVSTLEKEKTNIVGELTADRKKRQEMQEQIDTLQEGLKDSLSKIKEPDTTDSNKIKDSVREVLNEDKVTRSKDNRKVALDKFVEENKEFHTENDPGGLKLEAFRNKLSRFNTDGIVEVDEFIEVMNDAKSLLSGTKTNNEDVKNPYSSTQQTSSDPAVQVSSDLTSKDKKLMQQAGWSEERYLKLKSKMPGYVDNLLTNIKE